MTLPKPRLRRKPPRPSLAPALPALAAALAFVVAAAPLAGCRPRAAAPEYCPAPVAATGGGDAEQAYWRQKYRENRPDAPERYQVFPKPPRNNSFAEFDDSVHQGIDRQPALPALPADSYPLPPDRRDSAFASPPGGYGAAFSGMAGAAPASTLPASGVAAGSHFYPVEQLVYGGGYPDIDKPELYRLMPKDVVTMTVKDHPEFTGQMLVNPDGTVHIANTPDIVPVRGQTVEEAAETLRRTIAPYIKGECKVRLQTNRARGGYYYVFGDVLQPGRFPMGMEPVKLSEAVLAANWEANPGRRDADGDDLGPSFPAMTPRGKYVSPPSADLAGVLVVTPHRSQPVRTRHDVRSAFLGVTAADPVIRPGQIIIVPSLIAARNRELGLDSLAGAAAPAAVAPAPDPAAGFSGAATPARLPDRGLPPAATAEYASPYSAVETNMTSAFDTNSNTSAPRIFDGTLLP